MAIPTVDPLPDPPIRGTDTGVVFSQKTANWLDAATYVFVPQLNAFAVGLVDASTEWYQSSSTTSNSIGIGSKSFTVETGKQYTPGTYVSIVSTASPANGIGGTVTSYNAATGALVINSLWARGSGTFASWNVSLSGAQGPEGGSMLTSPTITGTLFEDSYAITDGGSVVIDPANGSRQRWTLGANRTPTTTLANGQSVILFIDDGSAFSITWSSIGVTWKTNGGAAPTLNTSGYTMIILTKENGVIYGARVGDA